MQNELHAMTARGCAVLLLLGMAASHCAAEEPAVREEDKRLIASLAGRHNLYVDEGKLRLVLGGINDEGLDKLNALSDGTCAELDMLYVQNSNYGSPEKIRFLARMPRLRSITFRNSRVDFALCDAIGKLRDLRALWLQDASLTTKDLAAACKASTIEVLMLDQNPIQGDIGFLKELKKLKQLSLAATDIDDNAIGALKELKSLKFLWIAQTRITADGYKKLSAELPGPVIVWREFDAQK